MNEELSAFSARFLQALLKRFPDWEQFRCPTDFRWQSKNDLNIEVPSRFAPLCPLSIATTGDGIIVSWGQWHVHIDSLECPEDQKIRDRTLFRSALHLIEQLLSDEIVVFDCRYAGLPSGGGHCKRKRIDRILQTQFFQKDSLTVAVRSWSGKYDRGDIDPARL